MFLSDFSGNYQNDIPLHVQEGSVISKPESSISNTMSKGDDQNLKRQKDAGSNQESRIPNQESRIPLNYLPENKEGKGASSKFKKNGIKALKVGKAWQLEDYLN